MLFQLASVFRVNRSGGTGEGPRENEPKAKRMRWMRSWKLVDCLWLFAALYSYHWHGGAENESLTFWWDDGKWCVIAVWLLCELVRWPCGFGFEGNAIFTGATLDVGFIAHDDYSLPQITRWAFFSLTFSLFLFRHVLLCLASSRSSLTSAPINSHKLITNSSVFFLNNHNHNFM